MAEPKIPLAGPRRWTHYGKRVMREGVPFLWSLVSFVVGVWIVAAVFGGLFVIAAVGGYRLWSEADLGKMAADTRPSGPAGIIVGGEAQAWNNMVVMQGSHSCLLYTSDAADEEDSV